MAKYNTPPKDWVIRMPKGLNMGKRKFATRTLQQGVTQFSRKKKNGSRLASSATIRKSVKATAELEKSVHCGLAFPKINLKNPAATPRVVIVQRKPPTEGRFTVPSIG